MSTGSRPVSISRAGLQVQNPFVAKERKQNEGQGSVSAPIASLRFKLFAYKVLVFYKMKFRSSFETGVFKNLCEKHLQTTDAIGRESFPLRFLLRFPPEGNSPIKTRGVLAEPKLVDVASHIFHP